MDNFSGSLFIYQILLISNFILLVMSFIHLVRNRNKFKLQDFIKNFIIILIVPIVGPISYLVYLKNKSNE